MFVYMFDILKIKLDDLFQKFYRFFQQLTDFLFYFYGVSTVITMLESVIVALGRTASLCATMHAALLLTFYRSCLAKGVPASQGMAFFEGVIMHGVVVHIFLFTPPDCPSLHL